MTEHDYKKAFPELKRLLKDGDKRAGELLRDDIVDKFKNGKFEVIAYLREEGYLRYLTQEELDEVYGFPHISEYINQNAKNAEKAFKKQEYKSALDSIQKVLDIKNDEELLLKGIRMYFVYNTRHFLADEYFPINREILSLISRLHFLYWKQCTEDYNNPFKSIKKTYEQIKDFPGFDMFREDCYFQKMFPKALPLGLSSFTEMYETLFEKKEEEELLEIYSQLKDHDYTNPDNFFGIKYRLTKVLYEKGSDKGKKLFLKEVVDHFIQGPPVVRFRLLDKYIYVYNYNREILQELKETLVKKIKNEQELYGFDFRILQKLEEEGDPKAKEIIIREASRLLNNTVEFLKRKGDPDTSIENPKSSLRIINKKIDNNEEIETDTILEFLRRMEIEKGSLLLQKKEYEQAFRHYGIAREYQGYFISNCAKDGDMFRDKGFSEEAFRCYNAAVELPTHQAHNRALYYKGLLWLDLGEPLKGVQTLNGIFGAEGFDTYWYDIELHRIRALCILERKEDALKELKRIIWERSNTRKIERYINKYEDEFQIISDTEEFHYLFLEDYKRKEYDLQKVDKLVEYYPKWQDLKLDRFKRDLLRFMLVNLKIDDPLFEEFDFNSKSSSDKKYSPLFIDKNNKMLITCSKYSDLEYIEYDLNEINLSEFQQKDDYYIWEDNSFSKDYIEKAKKIFGEENEIKALYRKDYSLKMMVYPKYEYHDFMRNYRIFISPAFPNPDSS